MQGIKEAVKRSPLNIRKHGGKYSLVTAEEKDPFVEGINFNCQFVGSTLVQNKFDHPDTRAALKQIWDRTSFSKSLKKMVIKVKAESLRIKDIATKSIVDDIPMYRISYCGTTSDMPNLFYFIHRDGEDSKRLTAELFKLESHQKVKALILTVQKAFNIAYKVWQSKKRQKEKKAASKESPLVTRKVTGAAGAGLPVGGSPQIPRRQTDHLKVEALDRARSGSEGNIAALPLVHPSVAKIKAPVTNEVTGSMHDLQLTDDFDAEFTQLAEARSQPDLLKTSIEDAKPNAYKLDAVKSEFDPGSTDNLVDI